MFIPYTPSFPPCSCSVKLSLLQWKGKVSLSAQCCPQVSSGWETDSTSGSALSIKMIQEIREKLQIESHLLFYGLWRQWHLVTVNGTGSSLNFGCGCEAVLQNWNLYVIARIQSWWMKQLLIHSLGKVNRKVRTQIDSVSHSWYNFPCPQIYWFLLYSMQTNYRYCESHNFKFPSLFACKNPILIMHFYV